MIWPFEMARLGSACPNELDSPNGRPPCDFPLPSQGRPRKHAREVCQPAILGARPRPVWLHGLQRLQQIGSSKIDLAISPKFGADSFEMLTERVQCVFQVGAALELCCDISTKLFLHYSFIVQLKWRARRSDSNRNDPCRLVNLLGLWFTLSSLAVGSV